MHYNEKSSINKSLYCIIKLVESLDYFKFDTINDNVDHYKHEIASPSKVKSIQNDSSDLFLSTLNENKNERDLIIWRMRR